MKKILTTLAIGSLLLASSAWGLETMSTSTARTRNLSGNETWEQRRDMREDDFDMWQDRQDASDNDAIIDYRSNYRELFREARIDCNMRIDASSIGNERDTIRSDCDAELQMYREAVRENIVWMNQARYDTLVTDFRNRLSDYMDVFDDMTDEEIDDWREALTKKLNVFEDKANKKGNDNLILSIAALHEIFSDI